MHFYHFERDYVLYELPMGQGWALHASAMELDPVQLFCGMQRASKGYVGMEVDKLMAMVK